MWSKLKVVNFLGSENDFFFERESMHRMYKLIYRGRVEEQVLGRFASSAGLEYIVN
jgi:hypothetical protein